VTIQQTADNIENVNREIFDEFAATVPKQKSKPILFGLAVTEKQCIKKQDRLEHDRTELARICQMLIDELNECDNRVSIAEAVIGDLKSTELIDMLVRNERMKESMLQEIED
jgi:hypothetical protein